MQRRDPDGVETAAIAQLVGLDGLRILDVGCSGRLTSLAAAHPTDVYAFDPDGDSVVKAKSSLSEAARKGCASRSTARRRSTFLADASTWRSAAGRCDAFHSRAWSTPCAESTPRGSLYALEAERRFVVTEWDSAAR